MVEPTIASASRPSQDDKQALRERLLVERKAIQAAPRRAFEQAIGERLIAVVRDLGVRRIAAYWPIAGEPDLDAAWTRLATDGIELALPVVIEREAPLVFRRWDRASTLGVDRAGVPAPGDTAPLLDIEALVAPCVGLHRDGWRLGYGGGYFDRTLAELAHRVFAIGIAFDSARCDFAPDAFDRRLQLAITPTRIEDYRVAV